MDSCASYVSSSVVAIIDSTIHATQKPTKNQHLHYNNHYKQHGMMTHLFVDFDGYIVCVQTNIYGRVHDASAARNNSVFPKVLDGRYALGNPGYAGVPYVVAGLKTNQLHSPGAHRFDSLT